MVATTAKARTITEAELENFRLDQQLFEQTSKTVAQLKTLIGAREQDLMERIKAGAKIEGRLTAVIDHSETRRITAWKEVARDLWGQLKLDPDVMEKKTKELTLPKVYPHVVVGERSSP